LNLLARRKIGKQNVFLVDSRQRHKGVHGIEAFLEKQLLLRSVAANNRRLAKIFGQHLRLFFLHFDDFNRMTRRNKHFGKIKGRFAAAENHNVLGLLFKHGNIFKEFCYFGRGTHNAYTVAAVKLKITVGNVNLLTALNNADKHKGLVFFPQIAQLKPLKTGIGLKTKLDHFKIPSRKTVDLDGGGQLENIEHLVSRHHFGVHGHGKPQLLTHKIKIFPVIFGISYAGNGVGGAHLFAHKAAQHIKLVGTRGSHNKVCPLGRSLTKGSAVGSVAANAYDVIDVRYFGYNVRILVDCHNIVTLGNKTGNNRRADFSAAYNKNVHTQNTLLSFISCILYYFLPSFCSDLEFCFGIYNFPTRKLTKVAGRMWGKKQNRR